MTGAGFYLIAAASASAENVFRLVSLCERFHGKMWSLETPIVVGTITEAVMRTFKVVLLVLLNKEC